MKKFLIKYKPQLLYTLFGTISTVIDIGVYQFCYLVLSVPNVWSYTIAFFIYVAFSFITNKIWVYESRSMNPKVLLRECLAYYLGRGVSFLLGLAIMWFGVDLMGWNSWVMKLVSDAIITVINYGFGFYVFQRIQGSRKNN